MPLGVVDVLELVHIQKHQRHRVFGAAQIIQRLFKAVFKQAAVRQPGQRVIKRQGFHLNLCGFELRDI